MKTIELSKIILENILLENRVKDVKKRYPELADGTGEYPIVDYFAANDPSGNNKYLDWMVKAMLHKPTTETIMQEIDDYSWKEGVWGDVAGFIVDLVKKFHNLSPYLVNRDNDGKEEGTTDLYQYKFTDGEMINYLTFDLDKAAVRKKVKDELKDAQENSDKIYKDSNWLVVRPNTWEASCIYGAGTKWCTASKSSSSHFTRETSHNFLIYVINKNLSSDNVEYKVAWQIPYKKNYSEVIFDDGMINDSVVKLWNATDRNFVYDSRSYIESIPLKVKLKIRDYVQGKMDVMYSDLGFSEDPKIQTLVEYLGLSEEEVESITEETFTHYSMPIYTIQNIGDSYVVANEQEIEEAKINWAEGYLEDLGYQEALTRVGDPSNFVYINDAEDIARDYAGNRIEDLSDDEVLEEASRIKGSLSEKAEEYEINKSIFDSNEEEIDELESKEELTTEEEEELRDLKLENEELDKDLNKSFRYIRDLLREEYYEYEINRLENEPLDWLSEMGYFNERTREFEMSAFKSGLLGVSRDELVEDLAGDLDIDYFSDDGDYSELEIAGETYFIFKVGI